MANHPGWRGRPAGVQQAAGARQAASAQQAAGARQAASARPVSGQPANPAAYTEPEVRRWPHPVNGAEVPPAPERPGGCGPGSGQLDAALYYIHCALSYQNQLLADITALLEQLAADRGVPSDPAGAPEP